MEFIEYLKVIGDSKLPYIEQNGHARPGCNGPYKNMDTAVRNSGHWIITYSYLYSITNDEKYYNTARKLAEFLIRDENFGVGGSVCCRTDARFDKTNGLIGQAWTVEALIESAQLFCDSKYYKVAQNIFNSQKFNENNSLWEFVDCDGRKGFDLTFNHQLWFAASGAMILDYEEQNGFPKSEKIEKNISRFLDAANDMYFQVHENGLIVHAVNYSLTNEEKEYSEKLAKEKKKASFKANPIGVLMKKAKDKLSIYSFTEGLEEGYQLFDLYGFALLKQRFGAKEIYKSKKLTKALEYAFFCENLMDLCKPCGGAPFNKFAFGYNSPAFEYPYVSLVFRDTYDDKVEEQLFGFQLEYTFKQNSFSRNCLDPETLDARIYELVRTIRIKNKLISK